MYVFYRYTRQRHYYWHEMLKLGHAPLKLFVCFVSLKVSSLFVPMRNFSKKYQKKISTTYCRFTQRVFTYHKRSWSAVTINSKIFSARPCCDFTFKETLSCRKQNILKWIHTYRLQYPSGQRKIHSVTCCTSPSHLIKL